MFAKIELVSTPLKRQMRASSVRAFSTISTATATPLQNLVGPLRRTIVAAPVHRRIYKAASNQGNGNETFPLLRSLNRFGVHSSSVNLAPSSATLISEAVAPSSIQSSTFHNREKIPDAKHVIINLLWDGKENQIRILWADGHQSTFHFVWLRDEDRSPACYDAATNQRLTENTPLDIGAKSVEVTQGGRRLQIEWDKVVMGVTHTVFDTPFLRSHCYTTSKSDPAKSWGYVPPSVCTWGRELTSILPNLSVPYDEMMADGETGERAVLQLLDLVRVYGVGLVRDTPHCKVASQRVVERVAPVRHTLYGGFWETKVLPPDDVDNIDSAYSTVPLPAHTDGNYFEDPPGLQIFHCLSADPAGGDTLLVDGFRVAESVRAGDPASFSLLCEHQVTYRHVDPRNLLEARHPVFGLDPDTGRLARFHYNNLDRAPARLPPAQVPAFYRAWAALAAAVEDPAGEVWCKLRPGHLIFINNRRVMHGRSRINARSGRVLVGCYASYEDYLSRFRVLRTKFRAAPAVAASAGGGTGAAGMQEAMGMGAVRGRL